METIEIKELGLDDRSENGEQDGQVLTKDFSLLHYPVTWARVSDGS